MNYYLNALKNYAKFSGRARRSEYWYFYLFNMIATFILGFIDGIFDTSIFFLIYYFAVLIPSIAVGVRRMHDVNKSGWFLLIPIYNLILTLTPGTIGENRFGSDPKEFN